jgi:hypothetical protein
VSWALVYGVQRLGRLLNGVALSYRAVFCTGLIYCVSSSKRFGADSDVESLRWTVGGLAWGKRSHQGETLRRRSDSCVGEYKGQCTPSLWWWYRSCRSVLGNTDISQGAVETGEIGRLEWTPAARSKMGRIRCDLLSQLFGQTTSQQGIFNFCTYTY